MLTLAYILGFVVVILCVIAAFFLNTQYFGQPEITLITSKDTYLLTRTEFETLLSEILDQASDADVTKLTLAAKAFEDHITGLAVKLSAHVTITETPLSSDEAKFDNAQNEDVATLEAAEQIIYNNIKTLLEWSRQKRFSVETPIDISSIDFLLTVPRAETRTKIQEFFVPRRPAVAFDIPSQKNVREHSPVPLRVSFPLPTPPTRLTREEFAVDKPRRKFSRKTSLNDSYEE